MARDDYVSTIAKHIELLQKEEQRIRKLPPVNGNKLFNGPGSQDRANARNSIRNCVVHLKTLIEPTYLGKDKAYLDVAYSLAKKEIERDITNNKSSLEKTNALTVIEKALSEVLKKNSDGSFGCCVGVTNFNGKTSYLI